LSSRADKRLGVEETKTGQKSGQKPHNLDFAILMVSLLLVGGGKKMAGSNNPLFSL
jgi:hypothetical protein